MKSTQQNLITKLNYAFKKQLDVSKINFSIKKAIAKQYQHSKIKPQHSKLLSRLNSYPDQVIPFSNLAQHFNLPSNIVSHKFKDLCFGCIDERVQKGKEGSFFAGIPGSFCLEEGVCDFYVEQIVNDCRDNDIHYIEFQPHANCGAITKLLRDTNPGMPISRDLIDQTAINKAHKMAMKIEKKAHEMGYDITTDITFIPENNMDCALFHNAVGAIVNVTSGNSFDLTSPHVNVDEFNKHIDPMFNIVGFGSDETLIERIILSIKLSTGKGGFANFFKKESPFVVMLCADSDYAIKRISAQLLPSLKHQTQDFPVKFFVFDLQS